MGYLPHDYKTAFCGNFLHSGRHSWHATAKECSLTLSILQNAPIKLRKAEGYLPSGWATLLAGQCADGMECMKAHGLGELRVLAAIQMGLMDMVYKTELCAAHEASQECQQGIILPLSCWLVQDEWHLQSPGVN